MLLALGIINRISPHKIPERPKTNLKPTTPQKREISRQGTCHMSSVNLARSFLRHVTIHSISYTIIYHSSNGYPACSYPWAESVASIVNRGVKANRKLHHSDRSHPPSYSKSVQHCRSSTENNITLPTTPKPGTSEQITLYANIQG